MINLASKASSRISLNRSLLAMVVGVFFMTINLRPEILFQKVLAFQLILAMPLFVTSILAYSKMGYKSKIKNWNTLGWVTFTMGYACLLNVVGILIGDIISVSLALMFFAITWIFIIIYAIVDITYDREKVRDRLFKDGLFVLIQIIFGVLVVLGVYS